MHLSLVLLRKQGTGSVDQTPALANQGGRNVQHRRLADQQLGQVGLGQPGAGVGVAPPGAGAGAGRVDQHAVEGAGVALQPICRRGRAGGARYCAPRRGGSGAPRRPAAAPRRRRRRCGRGCPSSPPAPGVLPPAPAHRSATRMPGRASVSSGDELAALVLDLHQARTGRRARRSPGGGRACAGPRAKAASGCASQPFRGQCRPGFLAGGLQQVDAQVERRGLEPARASSAPSAGPKRAASRGSSPVRHLQADRAPAWRGGPACARRAGERRLLGRGQRRGAELAAGEGLGNARQGPAVEQQRARRPGCGA